MSERDGACRDDLPDNPQTVGAEVSQGVPVRNQLEHTLGESQRVRDGVSVAPRPNLCNLQLLSLVLPQEMEL